MTAPALAPRTIVRDTAPHQVAVLLDQVRRTRPTPDGTADVLRSVSVEVEEGAFVAIMGPSGSGKSTLLNLAAGLDSPTSGRVVIGSTDLTGLSAKALTVFRRRGIGFVFQAYNLIDHLTVTENIDLPLLLDGTRPDAAWRAELLDAVGLSGMEGRLPSQLSGGQAQRVAIARALVTRPRVLFADEPTGALDAATSGQVLALLRATATRFGQTVVLVTHDPVVGAAADRVLFLAAGRIAGELTRPTPAGIANRLLTLER